MNWMTFLLLLEPHAVAFFHETLPNTTGTEKVIEIDRMNASGMPGKYYASFDYFRPVLILHDFFTNMEMPRDDFRFKSIFT